MAVSRQPAIGLTLVAAASDPAKKDETVDLIRSLIAGD